MASAALALLDAYIEGRKAAAATYVAARKTAATTYINNRQAEVTASTLSAAEKTAVNALLDAVEANFHTEFDNALTHFSDEFDTFTDRFDEFYAFIIRDRIPHERKHLTAALADADVSQEIHDAILVVFNRLDDEDETVITAFARGDFL